MIYNRYIKIVDYIEVLFEEAFKFQRDDCSSEPPAPMSHLYERPADKAALIANRQTRF